MEQAVVQENSSKWKKAGIAAAVGAITGFAASFAFLQMSKGGLIGELGNSREIAALVGITYLVTALAVGFGVLSPSLGARFLNVEDAEELREQRRMLIFSFISMAALAAGLLVLALAAPIGPISQPAALVVATTAVILAIWCTARQRRTMDELMQTLSRETASTGFYIMFLGGGGWSMLAHLEYVAGPQALDWLTMFAAALLAAAFISCGRRGFLKPR